MKKNAIRKRSQKLIPELERCQECHATENLERHHPDYSTPDRVEILCQTCHVKADLRDGTRVRKKEKPCKMCGKFFLPKHSRKSTTCGLDCLRDLGRRNAMKRWGNRSTDPAPETIPTG